MLTYSAQAAWGDDVEMPELDLADLHRAYVLSIRQHQRLVGDLCTTLSKLGSVIEDSPLDSLQRDALAAGIGRHVDLARCIIAGIDTALTCASPTRPAIAH